jgi:hypothetical protein
MLERLSRLLADPAGLSPRKVALVGIGVMGLLASANLVLPLIRVPLIMSFLPNEGWNALHSVRAINGDALYPASDAFVFNNYPPLSFYIVGFVGSALGDNIIAGRLISLLSILAIAVNVAQTVRNLGGTTHFGIFAGVLFVGILSKTYVNYVGINEPQLLAHAVMTMGLVVFTASPERTRNLAAAAFLMVLAGFIKQNIFAVPLAATIWLIRTNRRALAWWMGFSLAFLTIGFTASALVYGTAFFEQLSYPRAMSLYNVLTLLGWFQGFVIPVALWIIFSYRAPPEACLRLVSYLLAAAFVEFAVTRAGDNVSINSLFDCVIAASVAAGVMLSRLDESRLSVRYGVEVTGALIVGALCLRMILLPQKELTNLVLNPSSVAAMWSVEGKARQDVAFMQRLEGPALCENLSLCYWSGHQSAYDEIDASGAFELGFRDIEVLRRQITAGQFRIIQLYDGSPFLDAARKSGLKEHRGATGAIIFRAGAADADQE